ncbi:MAG TPA: DUF6356 family protein [Aquella sp.]|nr:DUF6356 family protein [Aquella sp.]
MKNIFTEHPHSVGETYWQHAKFAGLFAGSMLAGGIACLLHAIFPFLFQKTASNFLLTMMHTFVERAPHLDERIIPLSQTIENKLRENKAEN